MTNGDLNEKKLFFKTDELEKRIFLCEQKLKEKDGMNSLEFLTENVIMRFDFMEKYVYLNATKKSGCKINVNITSEYQEPVLALFIFNGNTKKFYEGCFPIRLTIPVIAEVGENEFRIELYDKSGNVDYPLSIGVTATGYLNNQPIEPRLDNIGDDMFAYSSGSSYIVYDSYLEPIFFQSGYNDYRPILFGGCELNIACRRKNDSVTVYTYAYYSPTLYNKTEYKLKCTDFCLANFIDNYRFFYTKGENLYMAFIKDGEIVNEKLLPIKAKKIRSVTVSSKPILYYQDVDGNWWIVEMDDVEDYVEENRHFLGKLELLYVYECFGEIGYSYKDGAVIIEKLVSDPETERILCGADESFRTKSGEIIARTNKEIFKVEEEL